MQKRTRYTATTIALATLAALTFHGPAPAGETPDHAMKQEHRSMMGMGMDPALMEQMRYRHMMNHGEMAPMMGVGLGPSAMHDLNLTRAQVRNITRIRKESAGEWAGTMAEMQEQHWELSRAMAEDDPDAERIGELHLRIREHQEELARIRQETRNRIMETLDEEQREQLRNREQQMPGWGWEPLD